jgi:hypothetical protein
MTWKKNRMKRKPRKSSPGARPGQTPIAEQIARGHETRDARPMPLLVFAIFFVLSLVIVHWVGWKCLNYLRAKQEAEDQRQHVANPLAEPGMVPPAPGVQPEPARPELPAEELANVREQELQMLGSGAHGWVDAKHQFVRVPLTEATDIAVSQGLPLKLAATQPWLPPSMPPASARHGPGGVP